MCTFTVALLCIVEQKKKLKKGKKDEKAAEKPDTFTEKLVSHLIKNLVVSTIIVQCYFIVVLPIMRKYRRTFY